MKYRRLWLGGAFWLLPVTSWAFGGVEYMLQDMARVLLPIAAGAVGIITCFWALGRLLRRLRKPEPATAAEQWAAGVGIAGLTLPASVAVWIVAAWLTHDPASSWYYPAVPVALLLGLAGCLLLWWRQRPTATKAVLTGLLVASTVATTARWIQLPPSGSLLPRALPTARPPMPLGLLGNPVFQEASFPPDSVMATADTSHVYEYVEQMPGFRGGGAGLKAFVNQYLRYPEAARRQGLTGIVQVSFVVQPNGHLTTAHIDAPLSAECDQEVLRMLYLLEQHFSPGMQNGQPVPVQEVLVFGFGLPTPTN